MGGNSQTLSISVREDRFCVYTHSFQGKVVYVGKGRAKRPFDFQYRSEVWCRFFENKDAVDVAIVGWFSSDKAALKVERELIKKLQPQLNCQLNDAWSRKDAKAHPKSKLFSVSFREADLEKIQSYLDHLQEQTGFRVSRNQFVSRAVVAVLNYYELKDKGWKPDFAEVLRNTDL